MGKFLGKRSAGEETAAESLSGKKAEAEGLPEKRTEAEGLPGKRTEAEGLPGKRAEAERLPEKRVEAEGLPGKRAAGSVSPGKVEFVAGMYILIFLTLLLTAQFQMYFFMITGAVMEDALAASNLASAVIDVREYGRSHTLQVADPDTAYGLYREALRENLGLDGNWEHPNPDLISGPVTVLQYVIYNVKKNDVTVYWYDENGSCRSWIETGGLHRVRTPDGTVVDATSVYSRITFPVRGILGIAVDADKDKTVDIVSSLTGEETE